jgi:hypothetical protein
MAERMLRDWTQSETVNELTAEAEVFFTRLIMKADDYGNYIGHPTLLKAALFPLRTSMRDSKIDALIAQCEAVGIIKSYKVDGKRYLHIPNYGQRMRTMKGKYPGPDGNLPTIDSRPQTNAGEEKGREKETEVKVKAYGPEHTHFVIVKSKYLHEQTCRINGKDGLIEYMEANQTVLNLPHHGEKFMRANNGKVFNELSHLQNAYSLYIEKQFK